MSGVRMSAKNLPSVFDLNNDGVTDLKDLQIIETNFGDQCFPLRRNH